MTLNQKLLQRVHAGASVVYFMYILVEGLFLGEEAGVVEYALNVEEVFAVITAVGKALDSHSALT